jgi:hypothetical protein
MLKTYDAYGLLNDLRYVKTKPLTPLKLKYSKMLG